MIYFHCGWLAEPDHVITSTYAMYHSILGALPINVPTLSTGRLDANLIQYARRSGPWRLEQSVYNFHIVTVVLVNVCSARPLEEIDQ